MGHYITTNSEKKCEKFQAKPILKYFSWVSALAKKNRMCKQDHSHATLELVRVVLDDCYIVTYSEAWFHPTMITSLRYNNKFAIFIFSEFNLCRIQVVLNLLLFQRYLHERHSWIRHIMDRVLTKAIC